GDYCSTSDSAATITAALTTLLANELHIFIPPGDWQVNPATPFALRSGQVIYGVDGCIHGVDPGSTAISRFTVPPGFTGVDIFNVAAGNAHGILRDFCIDLSNADVT